jgi:hypothetical protein
MILSSVKRKEEKRRYCGCKAKATHQGPLTLAQPKFFSRRLAPNLTICQSVAHFDPSSN